MLQRLHPDKSWGFPYKFVDIPTDSLTDIGNFKEISNSDCSVILKYEKAELHISLSDSGIIRIQVSAPNKKPTILPKEPKLGVTCPEKNWKSPKYVMDGEILRISIQNYKLEIITNPFSLKLSKDKSELFVLNNCKFTFTENGLAALVSGALSPQDEFYGCGGRTERINRKGTTLDQFAIKVDDFPRGDYGGLPMVFTLNPQGYGLLFNNPWPHVYFDIGYEDPSCWSLYSPDGPFELFLLPGDNFSSQLKLYYELTGNPPIPPSWMFGLWLSWCASWTADDWYNWVKRFRDEGWPLDTIVLDFQWRGGHLLKNLESSDGNNLDWDLKNFGNGAELIKKLEKFNVKTCLHVNTRMFTGDTLKDGASSGHLRIAPEDQVVPNLINAESREWNKKLLEPRIKEGTEVWWVDNGERVDGNLENDLPSRNLYGSIWDEYLFDVMNEYGKQNRLVLGRGAWIGAHRHTLPWPGDTIPGVDRFNDDLRFVINCAMSGMPFSNVDLGGFRDRKDFGELTHEIMHGDENIIRRVIHGFLLFPIIRIHNAGEKAKFPWNYSEKVQKLYRYFLELRYTLFPYFFSSAVKSCLDAIPMIRPLIFDYPNDSFCRSIENEILIGDSLLAAPVMENGYMERRVYLPEGNWVDYWTGNNYKGGREYAIDAELYEKEGLPLFVKAGNPVWYKPLTQWTESTSHEMYLDIFQGTPCEVIIYHNEHEKTIVHTSQKGTTPIIELKNDTASTMNYFVKLRHPGNKNFQDSQKQDYIQAETKPGQTQLIKIIT